MAASDSAAPNLYAEAFEASHREPRAISHRLFRSMVIVSEALADFLSCAAGMIAACLLSPSLGIARGIPLQGKELTIAGVAVGLLSVILLQRDGAYRGGGSLLRIRETERALRIPFQSLLLLFPFCLLLNLTSFSAVFLVALVLIPLFLMLEKQSYVSIVRLLYSKGFGTERVLVYGAGDMARQVVSSLLHSPRLGLVPMAVIDNEAVHAGGPLFELGYRRRRSVPTQPGPLTVSLLKSSRCTMLVVAIPNLPVTDLSSILQTAQRAGLRVAFLSGPMLLEWERTEGIDIDSLRLVSVMDAGLAWHHVFFKRAIDLVLSIPFLALSFPLFLLIALLIKLDSPGPALFVQERTGLHGRGFNMYKFRSMRVDVPRYALSPTTSRDRRITRIGRFLRMTSLDELPQLLNVLLGNMSLVGPRPEMPFIVEQYSAVHRQRLHVMPGITGLWQLSADRDWQIHENLHYDLYYIRNCSISMDLAILIHTLFFAMRGI